MWNASDHGTRVPFFVNTNVFSDGSYFWDSEFFLIYVCLADPGVVLDTSDSTVHVEHRQICLSSFADTRRDRRSLRGRVWLEIRVSVDNWRIDCSDEKEMLPAFVTDVWKPADL